MSLATKYRPESFEDGFYGQTLTAEILKKTVERKKFKNIMLFSGATGCGKTTAARIISKLINNGIDSAIEIDAASNSGVDQVRAIIDEANQRSLAGEYKIYIIDECHMMTSQAWNAFLKCIEECPKYTIFIFCTTDPQRIPNTVLNRMQRFNFSPISHDNINKKLISICEKEGFTNYLPTCDFISRTSCGCMREAITRLEQCSDISNDLSFDKIKDVFGTVNYETLFKVIWSIQKNDTNEIINIIDSIYYSGYNLVHFIELLTAFSLDLFKYSIFKNIDLTNIPAYLASEENSVVQFTVANVDTNYFSKLSAKLFEIKSLVKNESDIKNSLIILLLKICQSN